MAKRRANGEGSLYQRLSDGKWCASIPIGYDDAGKPLTKIVYGNSQEEVITKRDKVRKEYDQHEYADADQITVGEWVQEWLDTSAKQNVRGITWNSYEIMTRVHLIPGLGHWKLSKLGPQHIRRFLSDKKEKGYSSRSREYMYTILNQALILAKREGILLKNPCENVTKPKVTKKAIQVLAMADMLRFFKATVDHRFHAAFWVGWGTGMRREEILGLRWSDIDFKTCKISVTHAVIIGTNGIELTDKLKTEKSHRTIPFPIEVKQKLQSQHAKQAEEIVAGGFNYIKNDLVFCDKLGQPWDPRKLSKDFSIFAKKVKLPEGSTLHVLRHTHAHSLLKAGFSLAAVQYRLGHSSIAITADLYGHINSEFQDGMTEELSKMLTSAESEKIPTTTR